MILPFDSHNHIHMASKSPLSPIVGILDGAAIMSTHPRDFDIVAELSLGIRPDPTTIDTPVSNLHDPTTLKLVPCFGVHPWFLHELDRDTNDGNDENHEKDGNDSNCEEQITPTPPWIHHIEQKLMTIPTSIVGEIGLDGFHFSPDTGDLMTPMDKQVWAFELQMQLAAKHKRPVSIHTVQSFGTLMESLSRLKKKSKWGLPPKHYFHAFGGKIGTVDQLLALCGRKVGQVYFGFAPVVNFRSPKTPDVIRKVGIQRLVLETDHEDAERVPHSMQRGIQLISEILQISEQELIQRTTQNAYDLYGLSDLTK